jgi:hypothetical protein
MGEHRRQRTLEVVRWRGLELSVIQNRHTGYGMAWEYIRMDGYSVHGIGLLGGWLAGQHGTDGTAMVARGISITVGSNRDSPPILSREPASR